jgi:hypothetical protein
MNRRMFLRGAGGVMLGLPLLEGLGERKAFADPPTHPRFAVFVRQANGVVQQWDREPERFWPRATGALTTASMTAEPDKATSELKDYASKLILVRGTRFGFPGNGCGHSGGGNQVLTAARVSTTPSGNRSLAMGESVDNRMATAVNPTGVEPLTLYAGRMAGYLNEVLSYRGPMMLRSAERNPWLAYLRIAGMTSTSAATQARIASARMSVNDLVRGDMTRLLNRSDLSANDRRRLQLHFESIRDIERRMACELPEASLTAMRAISPNVGNPDNIETVTRMQMDIIAMAFACGHTRVATLQIGDGNDSTQHMVNGVRQPSFHQISHRLFSDGSTGDAIPDAIGKHHAIDRIHARLFKYLLDRMSAYAMGSSTLLDNSVAVWCNDLATGPPHSYENVPWVIAGSSGGYLRTGQYIDAGGVTHNKLFNTLLNAIGVRKADGSLVDDFGDASLARGGIPAMIA